MGIKAPEGEDDRRKLLPDEGEPADLLPEEGLELRPPDLAAELFLLEVVGFFVFGGEDIPPPPPPFALDVISSDKAE